MSSPDPYANANAIPERHSNTAQNGRDAATLPRTKETEFSEEIISTCLVGAARIPQPLPQPLSQPISQPIPQPQQASRVRAASNSSSSSSASSAPTSSQSNRDAGPAPNTRPAFLKPAGFKFSQFQLDPLAPLSPKPSTPSQHSEPPRLSTPSQPSKAPEPPKLTQPPQLSSSSNQPQKKAEIVDLTLDDDDDDDEDVIPLDEEKCSDDDEIHDYQHIEDEKDEEDTKRAERERAEGLLRDREQREREEKEREEKEETNRFLRQQLEAKQRENERRQKEADARAEAQRKKQKEREEEEEAVRRRIQREETERIEREQQRAATAAQASRPSLDEIASREQRMLEEQNQKDLERLRDQIRADVEAKRQWAAKYRLEQQQKLQQLQQQQKEARERAKAAAAQAEAEEKEKRRLAELEEEKRINAEKLRAEENAKLVARQQAISELRIEEEEEEEFTGAQQQHEEIVPNDVAAREKRDRESQSNGQVELMESGSRFDNIEDKMMEARKRQRTASDCDLVVQQETEPMAITDSEHLRLRQVGDSVQPLSWAEDCRKASRTPLGTKLFRLVLNPSFVNDAVDCPYPGIHTMIMQFPERSTSVLELKTEIARNLMMISSEEILPQQVVVVLRPQSHQLDIFGDPSLPSHPLSLVEILPSGQSIATWLQDGETLFISVKKL